MLPDDPPPLTEEEKRQIEREARSQRSAGLASVLGGRDGGGHLKGASPTPVLKRATLEIDQWLTAHLRDPETILHDIIVRRLADLPVLLESGLGRPAATVGAWLDGILDRPALIEDLVREVDMEWGRRMAERPRFEIDGQPPQPDDPYTIASVTSQLADLRRQCQGPA